MLKRHKSLSATRGPKSAPVVSNLEEVPKYVSHWKLKDVLKLPSQKAANSQSQSPGLSANLIVSPAPPTTSSEETTVGRCNCCAALLTYPSKAQKFRCSICNSTNVSSKPPTEDPKNEVPHLISSKYIKKLIDACLRDAEVPLSEDRKKSIHEVFEPLSTYLYRAFKSYICLNNSFRIKKSSKKAHYSTSNLDLADIRNAFGMLLRLPTKRPLYNALCGASEGLKRVYIFNQDDPRSLLRVLILLEIPFLPKCLSTQVVDAKMIRSMVDVPEIKALCYDILKRCLGILAYCHNSSSNNYYASWFSKLPAQDFSNKIDLINLYITFHLKKYFYVANNPQLSRSKSVPTAVPVTRRRHSNDEYLDTLNLKEDLDMDASREDPEPLLLPLQLLSTKLHKPSETKIKIHQYGNDWHIKTAAMVLNTFLKANSIREHSIDLSSFYNSLVDFVNMKLDFDTWQLDSKKSQSTVDPLRSELQTVLEYIHGTTSRSLGEQASYYFCQYPFLISLGGKISILEYEARKTMERKAEEAFINSLDKRIAFDVYFRVKVRREYIVQDSLHSLKTNSNNLKKSLRVQFINEPGVDAGGLKKEWFLLLTKAILQPLAQMFYNVEDSNLLWFNVKPLDNIEIYYLFGAILGLAIYNSTILELKFPLAFYKILLGKQVDLNNYRELFPESFRNLMKLKGYNDEELEAIGITFEVSFKDSFGKVYTRELLPGGSSRTVTSANLDLYIEKYTKFFMSNGISKQIDALARGFINVVGGNGLSLFLSEEIRLLLCGSDEKVDIEILKSVTKYVGWETPEVAQNSTIVQWFWEYMEQMSLGDQKKLLVFVTGSDRVPATGIQNLKFKISLLNKGRDTNRLPVAHTCFNEIALYNYQSKQKFKDKLDLAVHESSGFGIK